MPLLSDDRGRPFVTDDGKHILVSTEAFDFRIIAVTTTSVLVSPTGTIAFTILSDNVTPDAVNPFVDCKAVDADEDAVYVLDGQSIISVAESGARTILSSPTVPDTNNVIPATASKMVLANGLLYVAAPSVLIQVDPTTGVRTTLPNFDPQNTLRGLDYDPVRNLLLVLDASAVDRLYAYDLTAQTSSIISSTPTGPGSGPNFDDFRGVAYDDSADDFIIIDRGASPGFFRVDPTTGDRAFTANANAEDSRELTENYADNRVITVRDDIGAGGRVTTFVYPGLTGGTDVETGFEAHDITVRRIEIPVPSTQALYYTSNVAMFAEILFNGYLAGKKNSSELISDNTNPSTPPLFGGISSFDFDESNDRIVTVDDDENVLGVDLDDGTRTLIYNSGTVTMTDILVDDVTGEGYIGGVEGAQTRFIRLNLLTGTATVLNTNFLHAFPREVERDYNSNLVYVFGRNGAYTVDLSDDTSTSLFEIADGWVGVFGALLDLPNNRVIHYLQNSTSLFFIDLTTKVVTEQTSVLPASGSQFYNLINDTTNDAWIVCNTQTNLAYSIDKTSYVATPVYQGEISPPQRMEKARLGPLPS